jgi:splicing factor 3B subunit 3
MAEEMKEAAGPDEEELAKEMAEAFLNEDLPDNIFGAPKAGPGMWASVVRIMDPIEGKAFFLHRFEQNEAAMSLAYIKFASQGDFQQFVVIGVTKDLQLAPRNPGTSYIYTFRLNPECTAMEYLHKTLVDEVPYAMCPFQGKLLIGLGKTLRLFDYGKKKLLKKSENKHFPNMIVHITSLGSRIFVSDVQESVHFVRYRRSDNQLVIFADETNPRWVTTSCVLDFDTVAVADKFGNIGVVRLPSNTSDDVDEDPSGTKALWDRGVLSGASNKLEVLCNFHVGEIVLSMQKATLIPGGNESLVYTTISGTVGVLVPFTSHEDHDFFLHLEMHMRSENPPLCGRDHLSFRSYYFPVRNVIDGDLCEQFNSMDPNKQRSISEDLDRTPNEVSKKLEDIRTRFAF